MVLDSYRSKSDRILIPISRPFMALDPDIISLLSLIMALLAGVLFYMGGTLRDGSLVLIILSALFDAIDGKVARLTGKQSSRGDLVDHVLDRYSDVALLAGFIFSDVAQLSVGIFALIGVMLTSYMGTQSQALGLKRDYSGVLGRADRLAVMILFVLIQIIFPFRLHVWLLLITPTNLMLLWFAIAGNVTALSRFRRAYASLSKSP
ncbi:CDP-alcohol phosphatidyltransferase family protein [Thermoplasmatales archaeon AK]|nr:CDP-alcohol phosphatidyltransferase family protein [Thermoplasmatales archaeon AK]